MRTDEEIAVVIGVGGMGLAIARRVGSGRKLVLADVDGTKLGQAVELLRAEGHDVVEQITDVADDEAVAALARTSGDLGRVTHLAHTAGLSPAQASTAAILRVDLLGVALVLDRFAAVIAPGGAGVVIASMAGHLPNGLTGDQEQALATTPAADLLALPFLTPENPGTAYSLAKRANALRVRAAAAGAWGERGARVNSISPGIISTSMAQEELAAEGGEQMRAMVAMSPAKRLGTPDDIAAAASFLLDPAAEFVTGTDLLVDGGVVAAVHAASTG